MLPDPLPDPLPEPLPDLAAAKALANPLRGRILRELEILGEATSTMLATRLGVTTGGSSYNLRVLERHGFVEDVPERAGRRERWWRLTRRSVQFPARSRRAPELDEVVEQLNQRWLAEDLADYGRLLREPDSLEEWADALPWSRGTIRVTRDELATFFQEYLALLHRYAGPGDHRADDVRTVRTRFFAFPDPGPRPSAPDG